MELYDFVSIILIGGMIVLAFIAAESRDLLSASIAMGVVSLIVSILFYMLQAPDVAITEAAIGAALSLAVMIFGIKHTDRWEKK